jgi:GT2 family glycosyltransferase
VFAEPFKILVASPIRQKPAILIEFLNSLKRLDQNGYVLDYYFVDDNDNLISKELLDFFSIRMGKKCMIIKPSTALSSAYTCNEVTHYWKEDLIWKVAAYKDRMIEYARENNYDYLFLIDSDIVLHPATITQLILDQKEIVSNIFWTAWVPNSMPLPQVWLTDHYTQYEVGPDEHISEEESFRRRDDFLESLRMPGVYEVGGLGACTLISKSALNKGINFKKIKNLTLWGEDRHFCVRAAAMGISLFVDTHHPAYHIYREESLAGVDEFVSHSN